MLYKEININKWKRKKQYEFFKNYDLPFFNICCEVDVTQLLKLSKKKNKSFFINMLYASIHIANSIDEFRFRIKDRQVIKYESIYAGSTVLNDDKTFNFCYFDYSPDFSVFEKSAQLELDNNKKGKLNFDGRNDDLGIIYHSVIPWISFTSFTHPKKIGVNDSIPKIVFGKYQQKQEKIMMPISVEVHHALMDGYHLGLYISKLQELLHNPKFLNE